MSCANGAGRQFRVPLGYRSRVSLSQTQTRSKFDVFPIPPSFKLSNAARAGRQPQKPKQQPLRQTPVGYINPLKSRPKELSGALPLRLNASNFENTDTTGTPLGPRSGITLSTSVENYLNHHGPQAFGLATTDLVLKHFGTAHQDLYDFMPASVTRDELKSDSLRLFWNAFNDLLPPSPFETTIITPKGKLSSTSYMKAPGSNDLLRNKIPLHGHLLMLNHPINPEQLLPDGTDKRFLPGTGDIWQHRLWAGGSISLYTHLPRDYDGSPPYHMVERPIDLRIVGQRRPERVFVKIRKSFYSSGKLAPPQYNEKRILEILGQRPVFKTYNKLGASGDILTKGPIFEEDYELCFLRDPPNLSVSSKVVRPPENPKFTHTITPNRHLLFCWSALTYNAHLIHLDPEFVKREYSAPGLLVHGPLTLFLILEWFIRQLTIYAKSRGLSTFVPRSINYKNLLPLYVDQEMKLCMKPSEFQKPGELAPKWDVWIEKKSGSGVSTMAFKGQIVVTVQSDLSSTSPPELRKQPESGVQAEPQGSDESVAKVQPRRESRPRRQVQRLVLEKPVAEGQPRHSSRVQRSRSADIPPAPESRSKPEQHTKQDDSEEEHIKFESPFFP